MSRKAKILIYDLEVSTIRLEIETYGLKVYDKYHRHDNITRDYAIHGAAWKWLGEDKVSCISVSPRAPFNDEFVTKAIYDVFNEADIIVGHNIDRFDTRKLNTRALKHGLDPIPSKTSVDTLKLARRYFDITSNSMAYLARFLELGVEKDESPDWEAIRAGDSEALAYMREYNRRDVVVTEQIYLKLRSWDENAPNIAAIQELRDVEGNLIHACPACGSTDIINHGHFTTRKGIKKHRIFCKSCRKASRGKTIGKV